jgi:hypothetical protein
VLVKPVSFSKSNIWYNQQKALGTLLVSCVPINLEKQHAASLGKPITAVEQWT